MLSISKLTIATKDKILVSNVSFEIAKGEILAIVGESGSGKTLTALSLLDLLPNGLSKSGEISKNLKRGRDIGMIFQEPMTALNPLHKINKQIIEAITIHQPNLSQNIINEKLNNLLEQVGLSDFINKADCYPHQLSGGQRQRVMIAMAIANNPLLLIADEPTTALDVTIAQQIIELLKKLRKETGMAILFITHDLHLVRKIADRVLVMEKGKIVEAGQVSEVFNNPQADYTKKLLLAKPKNQILPLKKDTTNLLECKNLQVSYATGNNLLAWKKSYKQIVSNISFVLPTGSTLGIVGESGSGKTTIALALLRLIKASGEVKINNYNLLQLDKKAMRALRKDIAIVFQDPYSSLNPKMQIADIIREGLDVHFNNSSIIERNQKLDDILQEVGLSQDMKNRYPHEFSGGQRQRIAIARAVILQPKLIILDEPTSALDICVQAQILDLLINLQTKYNMSYIFISHDLRTIRAMSHNIMVMQKGKIVEYGNTNDIFTNPQQDYTKTLINLAS
jgi:microcin C transport system ATP-binding protein